MVPVTYSNSYVKAIIVFHVLVTVTYSNSYIKAIIVSTFWSATTKYVPQTNSVVRQQGNSVRSETNGPKFQIHPIST